MSTLITSSLMEDYQVNETIFTEPALLLRYYMAQKQEFLYRHRVVWEEIRHFYWYITLLLAIPVCIFSARPIVGAGNSIPQVCLLPTLALVFSIKAFFIVRRELSYYYAVNAQLLYLEKCLGLTSRAEYLDARLARAVPNQFTVEGYLEEVQSYGSVLPWKAKIKTLFLSGFVILAAAAIGEIVLCLL